MIEIIEIFLILATILTNFSIAWAIYSRNKKNITNIIFAIISFWFGVWGACLLLYKYTPILDHLFWLRGAYLSATCMEICIVAFAFIFPKPILKKLWPPAGLYSLLFLLVTIYYLFFSHLWIVKIVDKPAGPETITGPFYIYWTLGEWVLIFLSAGSLLYSYLRSRGLYRVQLQYLLVGFFIFGLLVNIPDVVAPVFFHTSKYFPISSVLSIIFTGTVSYIILKHRFMDLQRIVRYVAYYSLIIIFLWIVYFGITYLLGILFFSNWFNFLYTAVAIFFILIIRFTTEPWQEKVSRKVKSIFIQGLYEREDVLRKLNNLTTQTINLTTMVDRTLEIVYNTFQPEFTIGLSLYKGKIETLRSYMPRGRKITKLSPEQIEQIATVESIIFTEELPSGVLRTQLEKAGIAVVLPFHAGGWQRFILLGNKASGESYFIYDINTLRLIQPIASLLGQHIRQVEQIKQFNEKLKHEVTKATKEITRVNTQLRKADKLKNEFISIASHELKTPTTAIQGFLWLVLQKDKGLSAYSREKIERVARLTDHMTSLVNDMLDVSKLESKKISLHPEDFDLTLLIEEMKGDFDLLAIRKNISLTFSGNKSYMVRADKQRIRQVIANLLSNAIKYTREKGKISITCKEKKSQIFVSVKDTGIGIRKIDMSKLFTKFGKLDEGSNISKNMPGTGLGLYITKNLLELSGGEIHVASTFKKGSTFTFALPLKD